ncbi:aminotransferase DegT [archaeon]|nr:aminotransferase DegT [archaeon]
MISIGKPIIGDEEKKAVLEVLSSGILTKGEKVKRFEEEFAKFCNTNYAISTSSGTSALHASLLACGIKSGDEIITTPFTFISTSNSILFTGAKPVFVDIDEDTFNLDPDLINEKINKKTRAILPVHLYGHPADMNPILDLAEDHNLEIIEDACQAHGAEYCGKKAGSFGTGCFSFYPTKNMTTSEGGMITTNNKKIAEKAKMIVNQGSKKRYYHKVVGTNYRMTEICAAIGLAQLKKLNLFNKNRMENATYLTNKLKLKGIIAPKTKKNCKHAFHQYTIKITEDYPKTREELIEVLNKQGIQPSVFYPLPAYKQEAYKYLKIDELKFPVTEKVVKQVLSLPIHPLVSKDDLDMIAHIVNEI